MWVFRASSLRLIPITSFETIGASHHAQVRAFDFRITLTVSFCKAPKGHSDTPSPHGLPSRSLYPPPNTFAYRRRHERRFCVSRNRHATYAMIQIASVPRRSSCNLDCQAPSPCPIASRPRRVYAVCTVSACLWRYVPPECGATRPAAP